MENIPSTSSFEHICTKNANVFCYVCADFIPKKQHRRIFNKRLRNLCKECFRLNADIQIRKWAPNVICPTCRNMISKWNKLRDDSVLRFCKPAEWSEPINKDDCYFCNTETYGYNMANMHKLIYANVKSVKKPINLAEFEMLSVEPEVENTENEDSDGDKDENAENENSKENEDDNVENEKVDEHEDDNDEDEDSDEEETYSSMDNKQPQTFTQAELNDLVRDLGLPKDAAEYLASV